MSRESFDNIVQSLKEDQTRKFADEISLLCYAVTVWLAKMHETQPATAERDFKAVKITTEDEDERRIGLQLIFSAGTTTGTGIKGVLVVPEGTRALLQQLEIPFEVIESD